MTIYSFGLLNEQEQAKEVWQGEYITAREEEANTVMLYKVHQFYVEVYYNRENSELLKFNPFSSATRLVLYFQPCLN